MYSSYSPPRHMAAPPQAPAGTPPAPQQMAKPPEAPRNSRPDRMSFGDRVQSGNYTNWMQQFQNSPMQQFMGPGSKYAQQIASNPYLSQLQNIPFLGSLFGAPMPSIPGVTQQPQIGGQLPPTQV